MRCEVLMTQEEGSTFTSDPSHTNTDIEVWSEATAYRTALSPSGPRDLARVVLRGSIYPERRVQQPPVNPIENHHCPRTAQPPPPPEADNDSHTAAANMCDSSNLVDSTMPPGDYKQHRLSELQKLKANCKPEDLQKLKLRCEVMFVIQVIKLPT